MRVLLIQPPTNEKSPQLDRLYLMEPLGLEYLAAAIKPQHDVMLLDMRLERGLHAVLARFDPQLVGITSITIDVPKVHRINRAVKEYNPHIPTVVGGPHPTFAPQDFPGLDIAVIGPGPFAFKEIVDAYSRRNRFEDLASIEGIAFIRDGRPVFTGPRPNVPLDRFPNPLRSMVSRLRNSYFMGPMRPLSTVWSSQGCRFNCEFCLCWKIAGRSYRTRNPASVAEEIGSLRNTDIFLADDDAFAEPERMLAIAELLRGCRAERSVLAFAHADSIVRNRDAVESWRRVGLSRVFVGLEGRNDEALRRFGKRADCKTTEKAIRILKSLGIRIYGSFLVHPAFSREDFRRLADYVLSLGIDYPVFCVLTPLPGTDLFASTKNRITTRDYQLYDLMHSVLPTRLPLRDFYAEFARLHVESSTVSQKLEMLFDGGIGRLLPYVLVQAESLRKMREMYRHHLHEGSLEDKPAPLGAAM